MHKLTFFFFFSIALLQSARPAFSADSCESVLAGLNVSPGVKGHWNMATEVHWPDRGLFKSFLQSGLIVPGSILRIKEADRIGGSEIKVVAGRDKVVATLFVNASDQGPIEAIVSTGKYHYRVLLDRQQALFHRDHDGKFVSILRIEDGTSQTFTQGNLQLDAIGFEHLMNKLNENLFLHVSKNGESVTGSLGKNDSREIALNGHSLDAVLATLSRRAAIGSSLEPSPGDAYRSNLNDFMQFKEIVAKADKWINRFGSITIARKGSQFTVQLQKKAIAEIKNFEWFIESRSSSSEHVLKALSSALAKGFGSTVHVGISESSYPSRGVYNPAKGQIEWRASSTSRRGFAGVYNPKKQMVEWKESINTTGIDGVYNPTTEKVEWKEVYASGVKGVYNPETKQVEWKDERENGIGGIYNPETKMIEWKESRMSGVAGVFNPETKKVEWKAASYGGVAGYFDVTLGRVVWWTSPERSDISLVIPDQNYSSHGANPSAFMNADRVD